MRLKYFLEFTSPLSDACFLITNAGKIIASNPSAARMLGIAPSSIAGREIFDLVSDEPARVARYLSECLKSTRQIPGSLIWTGQEADGAPCRCFGHRLDAIEDDPEPLIYMHCDARDFEKNKLLALNRPIEELKTSYHELLVITEQLKGEITERRRIEAALRESEDNYRTVIETTGTGYVEIDAEGRVLDANMEYIRLTGRDGPDQVIGRKVTEWTAEHDVERNAEEVKKCMASGFIRNFEIDYAGREGENIPIEINATVLKTDEGSTIIAMCRNITERKSIEKIIKQKNDELNKINDDLEASNEELHSLNESLVQSNARLHESEQRYRRISVATTDYIYTVRLENGIPVETRHGAGCELITGYSEDEFANDPNLWLNMVVEEDRQAVRDHAHRILSGEQVSFIDHRIIRKDGYMRWVRNTPVPRPDENGVLISYDGLIKDITERKIAEKNLQESEAKFRRIFEESLFGAAIVSADLIFLSVNRALCRLLKHEENDFDSLNISDIIHPDDLPMSIENITRIQSGEIDSYVAYIRFLASDGGIVWGHVSVQTIRDDRGGIQYLIPLIVDISERKKLEEELNQAHKMEAMGQLAGGIAHDFNNLLTAIIGYTSLLDMEIDADSRLKTHVNHILNAAEKSANLIRRLLTFSRKQIISPKETDLNTLVSGIKKLMARLIGEDINLQVILSGIRLTVFVDPGQLEQVIINLCTNARDAMPEGGTISIRTESVILTENEIEIFDIDRHVRYALITINDTGTGMDEETQKRIFEPFFTTKEVGKGTGLGLSIAYGVVKQHRGHIAVRSEPCKGSTFRIYLPIIDSSEEVEEQAKKPTPSGGRETILMAEDSNELRQIASYVLGEFGYEVIEAIDGIDAIEKFEQNQHKIDLAILDVIMPGKNGREVYDAITRIKPGVRVLFTSGYTSDIISKKGFIEDGMNFISKPLTPYDLLRKIREILDGTDNND